MGNGFPVCGFSAAAFQVAAQSFANNSAKKRKRRKGISDFCVAHFFNGSSHSNEEGREKNETPIHRIFILSEIDIKNVVHFEEFFYRIR